MQSQERLFPQGTPLDTRIFTAAFLATSRESGESQEAGDPVAEVPTAFRARHHHLLALACAGALLAPLQACSSRNRDKEELIQVVKGEGGEVSIYRDAKGKFALTGIEGKFTRVDTKIINGKTVVVALRPNERWEVFDLDKKLLARGAEVTIISLNGKEFLHVDDNEWEIRTDDGRVMGRYSKKKIAEGTAVAEMILKDCAANKSGSATIERTGSQYVIDNQGNQLLKGKSISKTTFGSKDYLYTTNEGGYAICDEHGKQITPWYQSIDQKTINGNNDFILVQKEGCIWQLQRFPAQQPVTEECNEIEVVKFRGRDVLLITSKDGYDQLLDDAGQPLTRKYKKIKPMPFENDLLCVTLENGKLQLLRSDETPMTGEFTELNGLTVGTEHVFVLTLPNGLQTVVTPDGKRPIQPKPEVDFAMFHDTPCILVKHPDGKRQALALLDGKPLTKAYKNLKYGNLWWGENDGGGFEIADNPELRDAIQRLLQRLHITDTVTEDDVNILDGLMGDETNKKALLNEAPNDGIQYFCYVMQWAAIPVRIGDLPAIINFAKVHPMQEVEKAANDGRLNGKKSVSEALATLAAPAQ